MTYEKTHLRLKKIPFGFAVLGFFFFLSTTPAHAATQIFLTSGTSWTVPSDWNSSNNTIEAIGSGGSDPAGSGTGGGGYSKISNYSLTPGASVSYQVGNSQGGTNSGDTWFVNTSTLLAKNGGYTGGSAASGVGDVKYSGGSPAGSLGGGGAAGPNGNGVDGSGTQGGAGDAGYGGAGGIGAFVAGGNGTEWDATHGSGGGGGGTASGCYGGDGGLYGGGAGCSADGGNGLGGPGIIVITYTPAAAITSADIDAQVLFFGGRVTIRGGHVVIGSTATPALTESQVFLTSTTTSSWTVPANWNSSNNTIEVIGAGGGSQYIGSDGGGGGAYSKISNLTLTPGASVSYQVGDGTVTATTSSSRDTWFSSTATVLAKGGTKGGKSSPGSGGASTSGVGTLKYSGGNGGNYTSSGVYTGGGGGGAAGPNGNGNDAYDPDISGTICGGDGDAGSGGSTSCSTGAGVAGTEYGSYGSGSGGDGSGDVSTNVNVGGAYGGGAGGNGGFVTYSNNFVAGGNGLIVITYYHY